MEGGEEQRSASAATVAPLKLKRAAAPSTSFEGCRPALSEEVLEVVKDMGFESMTPVQVRAYTQLVDTCLRSFLSGLTGLRQSRLLAHLGSGGVGAVYVCVLERAMRWGVSCEQQMERRKA